MAYIPADQIPPPPPGDGGGDGGGRHATGEVDVSRATLPDSSAFEPASAASSDTSTPDAGDATPEPALTVPSSVPPLSEASARPAPPAVDAHEGVDSGSGTVWRLIATRDVEPSKENPLRYRERAYAVAPGTDVDVAERIARERVEWLANSLREFGPGKFLNVAIFDHVWESKPERPPLVVASFKAWKQEGVQIERPRPSAPPPKTEARPVTTTGEHDSRLADAFTACGDLLFLQTPLEAMTFGAELFEELLDIVGVTACLYDLDEDLLRVVVARGAQAEGWTGRAFSTRLGLFGKVAHATGGPLRATPSDAGHDPEVDARQGLEARTLLYVPLQRGGRLYGVVQLFSLHVGGFDQADADLAAYVGGQLSEFLENARARRR